MPDVDNNDILLIIIALFLPPLAVFLRVGCGGHFWLNLLLTFLFVLPGLCHAIWVILNKSKE